MDPNKEFDHEIIKKIKKLNSVPEREPQRMESGKAAFLEEAANIAKTVSPENLPRHKKWNQKNPTHLLERRKERVPMLSTFASIVIAVSLLLGGSGATVAAAQASEPGDLLYNIKLLSENAVLELTTQPESQFDLSLDLVDRRASEIVTLLSDGELITNETITRYRDQIEQAILLAYNMPEDKVVQAFEKIQDRLNTQLQTFSQTKTNGSPEATAALTQTRDMIQERVQILENGQSNLLQIMEQLQNQDQINNPEQGSSPTDFGENAQNTPHPGSGNSEITSDSLMDNGNAQNGNNPWFTETSSPIETEDIVNGQGEKTWTNTPQGNQGAMTTKTVDPQQGQWITKTATPQPNGSNSETEPQSQGSNSGSGSQNNNH